MTITDHSTSLTLAWTEQPTVEFTAGTLADNAACRSEVQAKLQRGTLGTSTTPSTTQVDQWLTRAKEELCERHGFIWKRRYVYADLTANTYRFAMPPDYDGGAVRFRDMTNNEWMQKLDPLSFDAVFPDVSEYGAQAPGDAAFCIKDRELWLSAPVSGTTRVELEYERTGSDNTATDVSYLPEMFRWRIIDYAVAEAFEILHQFDAAAYYRNKWEGGVRMSIRKDTKSKLAAINYQAKNWF